MSDDASKRFIELFSGRGDAYGNEKQCIKEPLTDAVYLAHLEGKRRVGVYPLIDRTLTRWFAVDIDDGDFDKARRFALRCQHHGLFAYIERSKSKGYHVWVFFNQPYSAARARAVVFMILEECEFTCEVFPKQDDIGPGRPYGNYLNLPLFGQDVPTRTVFVDLKEQPLITSVDQLGQIQVTPTATLDDLIALNSLNASLDPSPKAASGSSVSEVGKVAEGCLMISWAKANQAELKEPLWYAMVSNLGRLPGGVEAIHQFSREHPKYTKHETDQKILHGLNDSGPHTCEWIGQQGFDCSPCPWKGKVRSPVGIARQSPAPNTAATNPSNGQQSEQQEQGSFSKPISELFASPDKPVDWLVESLLEQGTIGFIGGEPKLTKSILGLHIAICLATGSPVLGQFAVPVKRRVLYIQEEDGEFLVKRRIADFVKGVGGRQLPMPEDAYLRYAIRIGFRIDNLEWQARLQAELQAFPADEVLMDVFNKIHCKEENSQPQMTEVMNVFEKTRREFGCGFRIVHHFRKAGGQGASSRGNQRLRGSSVLGGWSENSLYLSPSAGGLLRVEHEAKIIRMEPFLYGIEGELGNGMWLSYKGEAGLEQQLQRLEDLLAAITEAFTQKGPEGCTVRALAEAMRLSENTVRSYAKLLEEEDRVIPGKTRVGGKGQEVTYYSPSSPPGSQK